jgi:hypothetical protein
VLTVVVAGIGTGAAIGADAICIGAEGMGIGAEGMGAAAGMIVLSRLTGPGVAITVLGIDCGGIMTTLDDSIVRLPKIRPLKSLRRLLVYTGSVCGATTTPLATIPLADV